MPRWGAASWMYSTPVFPGLSPGVNPPRFILLYPDANAGNVPTTAVLRLGVFDQDGDIDNNTLQIWVNGTLVFNATPLVVPGYMTLVTDFGGRRIVEIARSAAPWPSNAKVKVTAQVSDLALNTQYYEGTFTTAPDVQYYSGNGLLPIEAAVLRPMTTFLDLEPVRQMLLRVVLRDEAFVAINRPQVAVRALYQIAYDTEISVVLNPYDKKNDDAMRILVREKRPTLEIDQFLTAYDNAMYAGLESLFKQGALPREYRNNFADYRTSTLYLYRVAAPVVAVFLARMVEEYVPASAEPAGSSLPGGLGFGDTFPFTLGG